MHACSTDRVPEPSLPHRWPWQGGNPGSLNRDLATIGGMALLSLAVSWLVIRASAGVMQADWQRHLCNMDCHWFMSILEAGYEDLGFRQVVFVIEGNAIGRH